MFQGSDILQNVYIRVRSLFLSDCVDTTRPVMGSERVSESGVRSHFAASNIKTKRKKNLPFFTSVSLLLLLLLSFWSSQPTKRTSLFLFIRFIRTKWTTGRVISVPCRSILPLFFPSLLCFCILVFGCWQTTVNGLMQNLIIRRVILSLSQASRETRPESIDDEKSIST